MPRIKVTSKTRVATPTANDATFATQSSALLALPAELKNQIFDYVCSDTTMAYKRRTNLKLRSAVNKGVSYQLSKDGNGLASYVATKEELAEGKPQPPGFLLACKQMYYESIEVFYASAIFTFYSRGVLDNWIRTVDATNLMLVHRASLRECEIKTKSLVVKKSEMSLPWKLGLTDLGGKLIATNDIGSYSSTECKSYYWCEPQAKVSNISRGAL